MSAIRVQKKVSVSVRDTRRETTLLSVPLSGSEVTLVKPLVQNLTLIIWATNY